MVKKSLLEYFRTPIKNLVLILIFSAAFITLCFSINYENYVQANILKIDTSFTTIAVPNTQAIEKFLCTPYQDESDNPMISYTLEADFYLSLRHFVNTSKFGTLDNCELLRGVPINVTPVLSGAIHPLEYKSDFDYPQNNAAFIVTAMDVEYSPKMFQKLGFAYSGGGTSDSAHYIIKFHVDEAVVLNPCYKVPEFIYAMSGAFTQDLQCPFEYGKQYFISGLYNDFYVIQKERDNGTPFSDTYPTFDENGVPNIYLDGSLFAFDINKKIIGREAPITKNFKVNNEATMAYTYSDKELSRMCVAYEGDLNSLKSKRPDIIKRLECAKVNANSIEIRTTNNLNSVIYFNQGKSVIMDGRNFTVAEISSGAPVCIVSKPFATYNNLKVGDSFRVDLYDTKTRRMNGWAWSLAPYTNTPDNRLIDMEKSRGSLDLQVVGIYTTPPREYSAYSLDYNTVFIPSNTVPVKLDRTLPEKTADLDELDRSYFIQYSHHMIPSLFSVIIPNSKLDEFKAEANAAGYGNYFIYNDQGYSQIKDTLPLITKSARIFLVAAYIGFFAIYVLYLVLLPRRLHDLGMLISLGAKRSTAVMSTLLGWLLVIVPALLLCFIVTMLSNAPLTKAVLNSTMKQLQYNNTFSFGVQESGIDLSLKFSGWNYDYPTILLILLAIFIIYLISTMSFYIWKSNQPVLKLLRRKE